MGLKGLLGGWVSKRYRFKMEGRVGFGRFRWVGWGLVGGVGFGGRVGWFGRVGMN